MSIGTMMTSCLPRSFLQNRCGTRPHRHAPLSALNMPRVRCRLDPGDHLSAPFVSPKLVGTATPRAALYLISISEYKIPLAPEKFLVIAPNRGRNQDANEGAPQ